MVNRLKAGALLVFVFIAGGAAGWGVGRWSNLSWTPRYREGDAMVVFLTKRLSLSTDQQDSVRTILRRHRPELDSIWHLVHPRMDTLRAIMHREINAQLTPAQQHRYSEVVRRFEPPPVHPESRGTGKERE
jgi:hypothetical protein